MAFKFPPLPKDHQWPVVASAWCRCFRHERDRDGNPINEREGYLGIGAGEQNGRHIWGVMSPPEEFGYISWWAYNAEDYSPEHVVQRMYKNETEHGGRFYFNNGMSGDTTVYVLEDDLKIAFTEMGFDIP